jgi:hypothetical protein
MLPVCVSMYLKSVLRDRPKYLILSAYNPDPLYVSKDVRILFNFSE